jgi:hypothetical protein
MKSEGNEKEEKKETWKNICKTKQSFGTQELP